MSQIKVKQIKLITQGDLMVGNATGDGSLLSVGATNQVIVSNGMTPLWGQVSSAGINLTKGSVFVGDATNTASEISAIAQGQVMVSGAGPSFDFNAGALSSQYVSFTPNIPQNLISTDIQSAIIEVASERAIIHTDMVDPTISNDSADTAVLGTSFKMGDIWVNTLTDTIWSAADVTIGAAVWINSSGIASAFTFNGSVDASNVGVLPTLPAPGDWWVVGTTGGTQDFNGAWSTVGLPVVSTFIIGDSIVYGSDGFWHKIDNINPAVVAGNGITTTGGPLSFIVSTKADETTITSTGGIGDELSVYGGLLNQVLIGQSPTADATWGYVNDLRDINGNFIIEGLASANPVNNLQVSSSGVGTNIAITAAGSDINIGLDLISKGSGRINLDGVLWANNGTSAGSILVSQLANDLSEVVAPNGTGDQVLSYNDTTNTIEWVTAGGIGGSGLSFKVIAGDSGLAVADTGADVLTISGGVGLKTVATDNPETLTINLDIPSLLVEPVIDPVNDHFIFYDVATATHKKTTLNDILSSGNNGQVGQDEIIATGGINESFSAFFTNIPLLDDNISILFNGIQLKSSGWSRLGSVLTLIDSINGYQTDAGDIISARYEY